MIQKHSPPAGHRVGVRVNSIPTTQKFLRGSKIVYFRKLQWLGDKLTLSVRYIVGAPQNSPNQTKQSLAPLPLPEAQIQPPSSATLPYIDHICYEGKSLHHSTKFHQDLNPKTIKTHQGFIPQVLSCLPGVSFAWAVPLSTPLSILGPGAHSVFIEEKMQGHAYQNAAATAAVHYR